MALSPDKLKHFESIGPEAVLVEIAEGKHGTGADSPLRRDAETWVQSAAMRSERADRAESNAIARSAKRFALIANVIAAMALITAIAAMIWR